MERQRRQNIGITLFPDDRILAYPLLTLDWVEGSVILFSRDASTLKHLHEQKKGDTKTKRQRQKKGDTDWQNASLFVFLFVFVFGTAKERGYSGLARCKEKQFR